MSPRGCPSQNSPVLDPLKNPCGVLWSQTNKRRFELFPWEDMTETGLYNDTFNLLWFLKFILRFFFSSFFVANASSSLYTQLLTLFYIPPLLQRPRWLLLIHVILQTSPLKACRPLPAPRPRPLRPRRWKVCSPGLAPACRSRQTGARPPPPRPRPHRELLQPEHLVGLSTIFLMLPRSKSKVARASDPSGFEFSLLDWPNGTNSTFLQRLINCEYWFMCLLSKTKHLVEQMFKLKFKTKTVLVFLSFMFKMSMFPYSLFVCPPCFLSYFHWFTVFVSFSLFNLPSFLFYFILSFSPSKQQYTISKDCLA